MLPRVSPLCLRRLLPPAIALGAGAAFALRLDAPAAAPEPAPAVLHHLPFPAETSWSVFQGNDQGPTHNDVWNRYAFDFTMPEGSPVVATADGVVAFVKEDTTGPTGRWQDNNEVAIRYADGTTGVYLHLQRDGALVEVGQAVSAGEVIGRSGNTGNSGGPHLHFSLKQGDRMGPSAPARFADAPGDGVPDTGERVTSGNVSARPLRAAFQALKAAYGVAVALDCREAEVDALRPLLADSPPPRFKALLERFKDRALALRIFEQERAGYLALWRADAAAAVEALGAARAAGDVGRAVLLARFGEADYAPLPEAATFRAASAELKQDPGAAAALAGLSPRIVFRRDLARALDREAKAHEAAAAGKKAEWSALVTTFEGLLKRAPGEDQRAALTAHLETLRAALPKKEPKGG